MKKIFLLTILLFQLTFVFGQKVLMEDEKVIQYDTDWGNWVTAPDNSNISFCAKLNWYDKQTNLYNWSIRRKVARTPIYYEWKIANQVFTGASDNPNNNDGYYNSSAYDSRDVANSMNGSGFSIYSSSKTTLFYQVRNVCYVFEGRNPNCNTISNNKNNNQQTKPQNDLSEYNRSKADLERQMNEKNAEIQRQNQENANKLNIWNNAIKAGVNAHNSGNYTEAKNQFSIAINNSTNESNRQNAQNYYNKSVDAEKSQTKTKATTDLIQGTLQILGDAHERKMQKLNAEIAELDRKKAIVSEDQKINTLNDPKIFETYCDYIAKNLEKIGFVFEKLENYTNIENKEKTAFLKFKGIRVYVKNYWSYEKMSKYVSFITDNQTEYQKLISSTFFINLTQLNPNYDKSYSTFDHTNLYTLGLEKKADFINIYNQGYTSKNYIGFINLSKKLDENAENKLKTMGNTTSDLLEKARLYTFGTEGVTKNYKKAVEIYQNAYNQSNDKEILREIGELYSKGDEYLSKNENKAEEYFLNYIKDNDKINPKVYVQLARIYNDDKKSALYDLKKSENYLLTAIPILEKKYNAEMDEKKREEVKRDIIYAYSNFCSLYLYTLKNPALYAEYAEKKMQWDENDYMTASQLAKLYADGKLFAYDKKSDNFDKDKKKAKYWASKPCEIAENLENKENRNFDANLARKMCDLLKKDYKSLF